MARRKPSTSPLPQQEFDTPQAGPYRAYNPNASRERDRDAGYRSDGRYRTSSLPDDIDRYDGRPRPPYPVPDGLAQYQIPDNTTEAMMGAPPAARQQPYLSGRRIVSGPAAGPDVNFSGVLRRVPVPDRGPLSASDPALPRRLRPREESSGSDEDDEDELAKDHDEGRRVRDSEVRQMTPPLGVGRTRSGSVGWQRQRRKR